MKIHEYQAKGLLAKYGVPVPRGEVASLPRKWKRSPRILAARWWSRRRSMPEDAARAAASSSPRPRQKPSKWRARFSGMTLVTHQTGPEGRLVQRVLVEETLPIAKELYAGLVLDRTQHKVVFMASSEGGMDIEEVAAKTPREDPEGGDRAWPRTIRVSGAQAGLRHRHSEGERQRGSRLHDRARPKRTKVSMPRSPRSILW